MENYVGRSKLKINLGVSSTVRIPTRFGIQSTRGRSE
jgi:hypothetical protein